MKSICNFQKNFSRPHLPPTTDFKSFDYCRWIIIGPNESVLKKEIPTKNVELNNLFKNGKADLLYSNLSFFSGRIKYWVTLIRLLAAEIRKKGKCEDNRLSSSLLGTSILLIKFNAKLVNVINKLQPGDPKRTGILTAVHLKNDIGII